MILEEQRKKVIEIALKVQKEKLVPLTFGNFSLRDEATGYVCITPSGMAYESLKPEDIVVVDVDCKGIEGDRKPSIEVSLHCAAYRKRPDVMGIVHTHSTYCTVWACAERELPCITAESAALVGGKIRCADFAPMGSEELAEITSTALEGDNMILMAKHGAFAVGESIDHAFANAVIVEETAKVTLFASLLGDLKPLDETMCKYLQKDTADNYGQ